MKDKRWSFHNEAGSGRTIVYVVTLTEGERSARCGIVYRDGDEWTAVIWRGAVGPNRNLGNYRTRDEAAAELWINRHDAYDHDRNQLFPYGVSTHVKRVG